MPARAREPVLTTAPAETTYRTDLAQKALEGLADADTKGESFEKQTVEVTPGGE